MAMKFWKPKKHKLPKLPTKWVLSYSIALAPVIRLARLYDTNPTQFWQEAPFLVSSFAAIFAGISALLALRSLKVTEEALRLTRGTTRPFLSLQPGEVSGSQKGHIVALCFEIRNSGPVPANLVTTDLQFFGDDEEITEDNRSQKYPKELAPPMHVVVFPDYSYHIVQELDLRKEVDRKLFENIKNGKVKLHLRMTYTAQGIEYRTVQTEKLEREEAGKITRVPIQPHRFT